MSMRIFVTACVAGLICTPAFAAAPAADAGPWARVPAPPTACYTSQDQYLDQNSAAVDAVQKEHYAANDRNEELKQKFEEAKNANPMLMAQAMQQAMMNDPQGAQKYLERITQQGQATQTEVPAALARESQIEAEEKSVIAQYQAALATANGPADARWTALKKKMGISMDSSGPGELGVPDWAWQEWGVILRERDQAYQANCATWFSATGPLQSYLKRYKQFLVQERIPYEKKLIDEPLVEQFKLAGVSTESYRTTTDYDAVEDYLKSAFRVFGERRGSPFCSADHPCQ